MTDQPKNKPPLREWRIMKGSISVNGKTKVTMAVELAPGDNYSGDATISVIEATPTTRRADEMREALELYACKDLECREHKACALLREIAAESGRGS